MNVSERIAGLLKSRAANVIAMEELHEKAEKEGRALDEVETGAFDDLTGKIKSIDGTVDRLRETEAIVARAAEPINRPRITIEQKAGKGIRFARMCQAIAASRGNLMLAEEIAKSQFPGDTDIALVLRAQARGVTRAAVAAGNTVDPAWAGALVSASNLSGELIELVKAEAIIGRLTQARNVPFNVRIAREVTALGTAGWVGEGLSKPVGKGAYDFVTIPFTKTSLITVVTDELVRFSDPSAETLMRDGLVQAISGFLDQQFVEESLPPLAGLHPGGINNGLPPAQIVASAGGSLGAIQADLATAVTKLHSGASPRAPAWIMHPTTLVGLQAQINGFGAPAFPSTANGVLMGYPVITSAHVNVSDIILLDQQSILLAMDPNITVDVSREASVQMDSAPATPPTPLVSFWQQNLIGLRAEQYAYWMRARDNAVVMITGAVYLPVPPVAGGLAAPGGASKAPPPVNQSKAL